MSNIEIRSLNGHKLIDEIARKRVEQFKTEAEQYTDSKVATALSESAVVLESLNTAINQKADKDYVDEALANFSGIEVAQADWNENDENSGAYVKNRTHYKKKPVLLSNLTFQYKRDENSSYNTILVENVRIETPFLLGKTYCVTWNNKIYNCICKSDPYGDGFDYLGNPYLLSPSYEDNGLPFFIRRLNTALEIAADTDNIEVTLSIELDEMVVHKLSNDYLDIFSNNAEVICPETVFSSCEMGDFQYINTPIKEITIGNEYTVYYNGKAYNCVASVVFLEGIDFVALGNTRAVQGDYSTIDELPFVFGRLPEQYWETMGVCGGLIPFDDSSTVVFKIVKEKTLNRKYLPFETINNGKNIFPLTTLTALNDDGEFGYENTIYDLIETEKQYSIIINNNVYEANFIEVDYSSNYTILVAGNTSSVGIEGGEEYPFVLLVIPPELGGMILAILDYTNTTATLEINEAGGLKIASSALPAYDWNASSDEEGYILNRTHWEEKAVEILSETEIIPSDNWLEIHPIPPLKEEIKLTEKYTITINGQEYEGYGAEEDSDDSSIIEKLIVVESLFIVCKVMPQAADVVGSTYGIAGLDMALPEENYTLKIVRGKDEIHKLDAKFLPDGIGNGGSSILLDTTLTKEGQAADAKAVGDAISSLNSKIGDAAVSEQIDTAISNIEIPSIEGLASESYVETKVSELVNSAPETLNTLNELATALGNDPNFATTISNQIGTKANSSDLTSHTGNKSNPHNVTAAQIGAMSTSNPVGTGSFSMGRKPNTTIGYSSYALGNDVIANGRYSHAEGETTIAYGECSHAEGAAGSVTSLTLTGESNVTSYIYSDYIPMYEIGSLVEYDNTFFKIVNVDQDNKIITFDQTLSSEPVTNIQVKIKRAAVGKGSHTEGVDTQTTGYYSHAEGNSTIAVESCSHAEGRATKAFGKYSHAEGEVTCSTGTGSHAEGYATNANGAYSHAEGYATDASGAYSHAEGQSTKAIGDYSHAEGYMTQAASAYQHIQGKYNIKDDENVYAHIVGNGDITNVRSNAHTLDWSGNAWFAGDVYVGSTSGENKDEGSKKLATEEFVSNTVGTALSGHTQAASTITAGTFGGTVAAKNDSQAPDAFLLRNSKLVSIETTPSVNGEICWLYE